VEQALIGQRVGDLDRIVTQDLVAVHLSPIDDIRADAAYRLHAATYLVRRALHGAAV
jgi:CO/xanthine dehydrogenase FAD-binding subunit